MRKRVVSLLMVLCVLLLTACYGGTVPSLSGVLDPTTVVSGAESPAAAGMQETPVVAPATVSVEYDTDDLNTGATGAQVSLIELNGSSIAVEGSGAAVNGHVVTITSAGTYHISGTLDDGQIIVDTEDKDAVVLVLNGIDITCSSSAPIYVIHAEKTVITLADGTRNQVTDGETFVLADAESDEPNAAIFSNDDLTINGGGELTVHANYRHGIVSQDDLKITGGNVTVYAPKDGIKGRDFIAVKDGTITVQAGGDGMQSNNDEDAEKGYISIEGGTLDITAGLDGLQAETSLSITGGTITISSGGGSANGVSQGNWGGNSTEIASSKGLKAGLDVTIAGGTIDIDSADDAIHSNNRLTIDGGTILLASGDDGMHADSALVINGGELSITQSYEGIESAAITINDGMIRVVASDDGINAAGGNDGSSVNGRPGQNQFTMSGSYYLDVNGGYVLVDAAGDGIDINGSLDMSGGVVIVNGPTNNGNGALDYLGTFNMSGGFLVAVGSSGMAQAPSTSSTQYSVMYNWTSAQAAGTTIHLETQDGEEILTFVPTKSYQSVVLSSPQLENGSTCVVYSGGSSTGSVSDGLYSEGTYSGGTLVASFTISSMVTGAGAMGGFPGGPGGGGNRPPGGRP